MIAGKQPKSEGMAFGDEIARLRNHKGWSRSRCVKELAGTGALGEDPKDYSEAWLVRLERGEIQKIPRRIVLGLAEALSCTERERARLLLLADKNILLDMTTQVPAIMELFNYQMMVIYEDTCRFLSGLIDNQNLGRLNDDELEELFLDALEMMIDDRRSGMSPRK